MEKAKVRIVGNYVTATSLYNRIDIIRNLPIEFTDREVEKEVQGQYCIDKFHLESVELLTVFESDNK